MVRVEEKESDNSHDLSAPSSQALAPSQSPSSRLPAAPLQQPQQQQQQRPEQRTPPPPSAPPASAILAQCLKLLRGQSDEHKFAGLVMVTKHLPALGPPADNSTTHPVSSSPSQHEHGGSDQLRQICRAVGPAFLHRLLRTPGDKSCNGAVGGLSVYQEIALGVLAAFFQDESLVLKFLPIAPALVRALRAADAVGQTQALCDGLYCAQALARVPGGMERLLRAGAAAAVVGRLSAAAGDRISAKKGKVKAAKKEEDASGVGRSGQGEDVGGGGGGGGVEESKTGGIREQVATPAAAASSSSSSSSSSFSAAAAAAATAAGSSGPSPKGFGGVMNAEGDKGSDSEGDDSPAARAETLAFAFVGRALEASGGDCLGHRDVTAVAEAFRDDPSADKFRFMDLLLRWALLQEKVSFAGAGEVGDQVEQSAEGWTKRGAFTAAVREGLLQALFGTAEDERRDSALALLSSLMCALGQEWAVEDEEETANGDTQRISSNDGDGAKSRNSRAGMRKRGTFVTLAVRCVAGEVRILLDEALSLFLPVKAKEASGASNCDRDGEAIPGTGRKAPGAMGPVGLDPSIGIAAEIIGSEAAAVAAAASTGDSSENREGTGRKELGLGDRTPLSTAQSKEIRGRRAARLLRMVPVSLEIIELIIAFLCEGGNEAEDEDSKGGEGERGKTHGRWVELPVNILESIQKTLAGLFGCILDFFSEIRPWIVPDTLPKGNAQTEVKRVTSPGSAPSIVDMWSLRRLGLMCSRTLGVWVAEDPESLALKFLDNLPVLLGLNAAAEAPDSDDEESDDEDEEDDRSSMMTPPTLAAFPGAARYVSAGTAGGLDDQATSAARSATRADESLHNILRAMLALSYETTPLAAMVEEGVTARLARLAAAGPPAIAALLGNHSEAAAAAAPSQSSSRLLLPPPEQLSEAVRSPLITACGLLTNILTSAGHLAWPETPAAVARRRLRRAGGNEKPIKAPSHPVLTHPGMGECMASLAEVASAAGAVRRAGGGARWRLLVAHATLVVMTVAREAAAPGKSGLVPASDIIGRKGRFCWASQSSSSSPSSPPSASVWLGMARAVDEGLGSLSVVPGRGLVGGGSRETEGDEEATYEEGVIWQWCLECAREMEAAFGGAAGNPYVSSGVVPQTVLKSLIEASSDGRI